MGPKPKRIIWYFRQAVPSADDQKTDLFKANFYLETFQCLKIGLFPIFFFSIEFPNVFLVFQVAAMAAF